MYFSEEPCLLLRQEHFCQGRDYFAVRPSAIWPGGLFPEKIQDCIKDLIMKYLPTLILALFSTACAELYTGRSYLSEMEQGDSTFFEAESDFPVVAGDSGRNWRSDKEISARTPASEEDILERRGQRSLKDELRHLENTQSENALGQYLKYKHKFGNISEKIYFLKLPYSERKDYLADRGFLEDQLPTRTAYERMSPKRKSDIILGMSKEDVMFNWGKPVRVEIAGNPSYENERWAYTYNGATKYIYFEGGLVEGWE